MLLSLWAIAEEQADSPEVLVTEDTEEELEETEPEEVEDSQAEERPDAPEKKKGSIHLKSFGRLHLKWAHVNLAKNNRSEQNEYSLRRADIGLTSNFYNSLLYEFALLFKIGFQDKPATASQSCHIPSLQALAGQAKILSLS